VNVKGYLKQRISLPFVFLKLEEKVRKLMQDQLPENEKVNDERRAVQKGK